MRTFIKGIKELKVASIPQLLGARRAAFEREVAPHQGLSQQARYARSDYRPRRLHPDRSSETSTSSLNGLPRWQRLLMPSLATTGYAGTLTARQRQLRRPPYLATRLPPPLNSKPGSKALPVSPNHSVKRTAPGVPGSAAYLKR